FVIEHPQWIPPETQKKLNLRAGDDKGRIYRVYPADAPPRKSRWLHKMSGQELVAQLELPNGILRDLAHQMIVWNGDKSTVASLETLLKKSLIPQARLHALSAL